MGSGPEARWVCWRFRFSYGGAQAAAHRLDERVHPEDGDHPLQIVGENVKAHLRADLFEGARPEADRAHPRLDGSEWMFRGLESDAHGLGARSNRSCIASRTASCSQRLTRRSFAGAHFDFSAQPAGLKSGEEGGRKSRLAPAASIILRTIGPLRLDRLSMTTMSPCRSSGPERARRKSQRRFDGSGRRGRKARSCLASSSQQ
jgi:hypothetical protein